MEHEEQSLPVKGFGTNTNGIGILIVTIVAVCLALFCWDFWKDGSKEINHYRLNSQPTHQTGNDYEQGEKPGETPSSKASTTVEPSSDTKGGQIDTLAPASEKTDTAAHAAAKPDSTKH